MSDLLNNIGVIVAIVMSALGLLISLSRSKHQNSADDGSTMKAIVETSSLTATARLEAERRSQTLETRITELEKILSSMSYRVTFVVHTGEEPRIEKISIERFPASKSLNTKASL
jgi:hypothetical protein